jgi:hypothetical protein
LLRCGADRTASYLAAATVYQEKLARYSAVQFSDLFEFLLVLFDLSVSL